MIRRSNLFLILTVCFNQQAFSDWLCREAFSQKLGQVITSCGVGKSEKLEQARVNSRESAVEEFNRVCQLSKDCSDFDYTVVPKRTECEILNNIYTCYRALDFEITESRKRSLALDLNQIENQLKTKEQEIQDLQIQIDKLAKLRSSQQEAETKQQTLKELESDLNQKEAEALKLGYLSDKSVVESGGYKYLHQIYKSSFKFSFHYWDSKLTDDSEKDVIWLATYEKRPYNWLGLQIFGGFSNGRLMNQKSAATDVPTMGTSNSTQVYNGKVALADIGVAGLVYPGWSGAYLKVELGTVKGIKETHSINYNGAGVGQVVTDKKDLSATYYGAQIGFDSRDDIKGWGLFSEIGFRSSGGKIGMIGGLGINYGF